MAVTQERSLAWCRQKLVATREDIAFYQTKHGTVPTHEKLRRLTELRELEAALEYEIDRRTSGQTGRFES